MDTDLTPFINAGIPGLLLLWFMLRLERILNRYDKTLNLMARAIIRQLERHEPEAASELSRKLYSANGDES
ncbi:MAG: hypothetical protein IIC83_03495 [Chloroflexi bacterium]|nr:hypothetical protein [Chloroflexota bacterium]